MSTSVACAQKILTALPSKCCCQDDKRTRNTKRSVSVSYDDFTQGCTARWSWSTFQAPVCSIPLNCLSGSSLLNNLLTLQVQRDTSTQGKRIRAELYFLETFISSRHCEGKWACLAPRSRPTQWFIQMSDKGEAVPRIAGPLNCGTGNFQAEPGHCQEEDRGQMPGCDPALRAGGPWGGRRRCQWGLPPCLKCQLCY